MYAVISLKLRVNGTFRKLFIFHIPPIHVKVVRQTYRDVDDIDKRDQ